MTITGNAILPAERGGGGGSTPTTAAAPSTTASTATPGSRNHIGSNTTTLVAGGLMQTPSFTMLEPASYMTALQLTTDTCQGDGRTPLLHASVTSTCSLAALPPSAILPPASKHQIVMLCGSVAAAGSATSARSKATAATLARTQCACTAQLRVCGTCQELHHMHAARAGTPEFRPPEVLLKHTGQRSAISLCAVGVMLLSILSRSYLFFCAGRPDSVGRVDCVVRKPCPEGVGQAL